MEQSTAHSQEQLRRALTLLLTATCWLATFAAVSCLAAFAAAAALGNWNASSGWLMGVFCSALTLAFAGEGKKLVAVSRARRNRLEADHGSRT